MNRPRTPKRVLLEVRLPVAGEFSGLKTTRSVKWIFPGETLTVGRSAQHVELAFESDKGMSKRHFEISFDGETCKLTDLYSTNGTRVNGKPVKRSVCLEDGDEVCAGKTIFGVGILDEADQDPPGRTVDTGEMTASDLLEAARAGADDTEIPAETTVRLPKTATLRLITRWIETKEAGFSGRQMVWIRAGQCVVVGSSEMDADWQVPVQWGLSPVHFKVSYDGAIFALQSCSDQTPTLVNGEAVTEIRLSDGDTIKAGAVGFFVQLS